MRSRSYVLLVACAVLGMVSFSQEASAWERGHTKVNASLKYEQQWDDNIFYDTNDPKSDFVSLVTPQIGGEFGFGDNGKHKLRANYAVECGMFAFYNSQNYANQDVSAAIALDFDKYRSTTGDRFLFTSDRAGTEFQTRTLRKENTLSQVFEADGNKFSGDVGYSLYNVDYLSDTLNNIDRYENSVWTTGYVSSNPRQKLFSSLGI